MFSTKIICYKSKKYKDGKSPVLLRMIVNRKPKYYSLPGGYKCNENQWNYEANRFKQSYPNATKANRNLADLERKIAEIIIDLESKNPDFGHQDFTQVWNRRLHKLYLFDYYDEIIKRLENKNKIGNANAYTNCKNAFMKEWPKDIEMKAITLKMLNQFTDKCIKAKLKGTTISHRLRNLRALYTRAIKEEGLEYTPFLNYDWSQLNIETGKRALDKNDVMKIYRYELNPLHPWFNTKSYFVFSYLCYGLNYADMARLEPKNIEQEDGLNILKYKRSKGGRSYQVPLCDEAMNIINRFRDLDPKSKYIFPILDENTHKTERQITTRINTALKKFNSELRDIAKELGINKHLTSYVARHSFATIMKKEKIDISMISEMLGHRDEKTTRTYLKSFDHSDKIDAGNRLID